MKKCIAYACLVSLVLVSTSMSAVTAECADQRGVVSTSYSAEKEVAPDTVEVSIAIKTSDKKLMNTAVTKNKEISNNVYNYLKSSINLANGDFIKTSNYNATQVYRYVDSKRIFDKYEVSNNLIVHTKSIDKIGALIDKSIELGATSVNSLNFSLSEKDSQCEELLKSAAKNARKRADIVAQASGTTIAGIKDVSTSCSLNNSRSVYSRNMLMKSAATADMAAGESSTAIESGNVKIYANVNAVYYVK